MPEEGSFENLASGIYGTILSTALIAATQGQRAARDRDERGASAFFGVVPVGLKALVH